MADITTVYKKLVELRILKKRRRELKEEKDRLSCAKPKTKEQLIEEKEKEVAAHSDLALGITAEKPKEPEKRKVPMFRVPMEKPREKSVELPYKYNIVWMIRSVAFVILFPVFIAITGDSLMFIPTVYGTVWLFLWLFAGEGADKENFKFKGVWLGFVHIFNLYRLPAYVVKKEEAAEYNKTEYPRLLKEYYDVERPMAEEYKKQCEMADSEYEKNVAEYEKGIKEYENARAAAIKKLVLEYAPEAEKESKKLKEEYEGKIKDLEDQIKKINEQIGSFGDIDDSIMFDPERYDEHEIAGISGVINEGRASSLKEAINVYLDDERKDYEERQRQIEAEEMARIAEMEAERRIEENSRHNREMEYAAERSERRVQEESENLLKMQKAQALNEARRLCQSCKYKGSCHHVILGDPPINCTKYRGYRE